MIYNYKVGLKYIQPGCVANSELEWGKNEYKMLEFSVTCHAIIFRFFSQQKQNKITWI